MSDGGKGVARPAPAQPRPPEARVVFRGVLFDVWQWRQDLFDGSAATFETLSRPDTALILPVLPDGRVLLADEEQPGGHTHLRALGGRVDPGETPEAAARRELLEEAGYVAAELVPWAAWQPVAKIDWAVYLFVAHGLTRTGSSPDPGERIALRKVDAADLLAGAGELVVDDVELAFRLWAARADATELARAAALLDPRGRGRSTG